MTNAQAMVEQGWGAELARLIDDGYTLLYDYGDGELPVALFGKVANEQLHLRQGSDLIVLVGEDFEQIASTIMGMLISARAVQG
jgi:hypothetical protein